MNLLRECFDSSNSGVLLLLYMVTLKNGVVQHFNMGVVTVLKPNATKMNFSSTNQLV